jgi:hypothetical protein
MATTDLVTQRMNAIVEKEGGNSAGTIEEALGGQVDETLTNNVLEEPSADPTRDFRV